MLVLEALEEHGRMRFTRLGEFIGGVSQKMLTKTLRQMEADGLVSRTVFPVIPPRVEYELTALGHSLGTRRFVACGSGPSSIAKRLKRLEPDFENPQKQDLGHPAFRETLPNGVPGDKK